MLSTVKKRYNNNMTATSCPASPPPPPKRAKVTELRCSSFHQSFSDSDHSPDAFLQRAAEFPDLECLQMDRGYWSAEKVVDVLKKCPKIEKLILSVEGGCFEKPAGLDVILAHIAQNQTPLRLLAIKGYEDCLHPFGRDMAAMLEANTTLTTLHLEGLDGRHMDPVLHVLASPKSRTLRNLVLRKMDFYPNDCEAIAEVVRGETALESVDLSGNGIRSLGCMLFADTTRCVQRLILRDCQIGDAGLYHLAKMVKGTTVTELDVGENHFTYESIRYMADALKKNQHLRYLCLGAKIGHPNTPEMLTALTENRTLEKLDTCLEVYSGLMTTLLEVLRVHTSLKYLRVSFDLPAEELASFFHGVENSEGLKSLEIVSCEKIDTKIAKTALLRMLMNNHTLLEFECKSTYKKLYDMAIKLNRKNAQKPTPNLKELKKQLLEPFQEEEEEEEEEEVEKQVE